MLQALVSMGNSKSPRRNNGIIQEFYVCFLAEICSFLVNTLSFCYEQGDFSSSWKQAIIAIIDKKGKDERLIKTGEQFFF